MSRKEITQRRRRKTAVKGDKDLMAIDWSEASKAAPTKVKVVKRQLDSAEKAFRHAEDPYKGKKSKKKHKAKKGKR